MATSTIQVTNGGSISWKPLTFPPRGSLGRGATRAEGAGQLRDPQVHQVKIGVNAVCTLGVGWYNHGPRASALSDVLHLTAVVIIGRQQYLDVLFLHCRDDLLHVPRRGWDTRLGLDIVEAIHPELAREVVPLFMVAGDQLAAERHPLFEPAPQAGDERGALVLPLVQEIEQSALPVEVGQCRAAKQPHQLVAEQRPIHPVLEVLFPGREEVSVLRRYALQAGQDIPRDLDRVQRVGPDVWVPKDVNVSLGAREAGRQD